MATHQHAHQHTSMPINIITDAFEDKKPEYYKICSVLQRKTTNQIPTLVKSSVIQFPTSRHRKTHVNAQIRVLEYLRSVQTGLNASNRPTLTSQPHSKQRLRRWAILNNKEVTLCYKKYCVNKASMLGSQHILSIEIFESSILLDEAANSYILFLESVGIIKTQGSHKSLC